MQTPMMPPPTITTSARGGRTSSAVTGSTRGAIGTGSGRDRGEDEEPVGRFRTICVLDPLTSADLATILCNLETGPLQQIQGIARLEGFELQFSSELLGEIVRRAVTNGLGARCLQGLVQQAAQRAFFELPSQLRHRREYVPVAHLGLQSLVDGSYELVWEKTAQVPQAQPAEESSEGEENAVEQAVYYRRR